MTSTPSRGVALAALAALACASARAPAPEAADAAARPGRLVVAPLNLGLRAPQELRGSEGRVWSELLRYLRQQDRALGALEPSGAERLWAAVVAELAASGAPPELGTASSRFARELRAQVDYDLLVLPSLVLRRARVSGYQASWDGVHRALPVREALLDKALIEATLPGVVVWGFRGRIAAASLHVAILGASGESIYEGLAGLDVVQELRRERQRGALGSQAWRLEPRPDLFANAEDLHEGVERAFARSVPRTARLW
jgi:hypothetical protein